MESAGGFRIVVDAAGIPLTTVPSAVEEWRTGSRWGTLVTPVGRARVSAHPGEGQGTPIGPDWVYT
jgi:hypothetical protein